MTLSAATPMIRAIVFDFDGTLVDASEVICASLNAILRDHSLPEQPTPWIRAQIGRPLREVFAHCDPRASQADIDAYIDEYRIVFRPLSRPMSRVIPGVPEALDTLPAEVRLGIATSRKVDGAAYILEGLGLLGRFGALVGIDEVTHVKPDPEPVLLALKLLGVAPHEAMMVGDTPDDVQAGIRAGATSVGVTTGAHRAGVLAEAGAHHVIGSMAHLPALVRAATEQPQRT